LKVLVAQGSAVLVPEPSPRREPSGADRRVDERPLAQHQAAAAQDLQRLVEQGRAVSPLTQPRAERADGAVVGRGVVEGEADEAAEADAVLEHLLGRGVGQPEALLDEQHLEHGDHGPVGPAAGRGVVIAEDVGDRSGQLVEGDLAPAGVEERPRPRPAQVGHGQVGERRCRVNAFHQKPPCCPVSLLAPRAA